MPILDIIALRKSYRLPGGVTRVVVNIAGFSLGEGEALGLRGESGTGKTTFLHLIAGLIKPDTGTILLDGIDLTGLSEARRDRLRASGIGCVYQNFNLLQGYSCLENVMLAMAFAGLTDPARATALLQRVGLGDRLHDSPRTLSVGQQQRVAVARALVNRPRLVLADEPTGNLDPANAEAILALLREACAEQGAALLLVSHDPRILAALPARRDLRDFNTAASTPIAA